MQWRTGHGAAAPGQEELLMVIKRILVAVFVSVVSLASVAAYRFQVPENRSIVAINPDASITIRYAITFRNEGQPIDIIDVGLPDRHYGDVSADLDGIPMRNIRKSEVLSSGVEVHLGGHAIPAGATGTLHLTATAFDRVFPDRKDKTYASAVFTPTWYGAKYTSGTTHLVCQFVLPSGVGPEEPRYHGRAFTSAAVKDGRVVYTWDIPNASPSKSYTFGASFPARVMQRVAEEPRGPGPAARLLGALLALIGAALPLLFVAFFIGIMILVVFKAYRRRLKYLPATVGMEGVEIRRGLTVPEVAVLMERPVDKVMALLLFGMIRKGFVKVAGRNPLKLEIAKDRTIEFDYERAFAKAVEDDGRIDEGEAAKVLTDLIKRVTEKMRGFNRKKTLAYYNAIMKKAWGQVGSEDYSQAFEWLILDKEFGKRATERFGPRPMPLPVWWVPMYTGHYNPAGTGQSAPTTSLPSGPVAAANSIVSSVESFSHDLVNSVPGLATKVTQTTNPVPQSSGGGHSGGGCACACACAGCACACAGGGR